MYTSFTDELIKIAYGEEGHKLHSWGASHAIPMSESTRKAMTLGNVGTDTWRRGTHPWLPTPYATASHAMTTEAGGILPETKARLIETRQGAIQRLADAAEAQQLSAKPEGMSLKERVLSKPKRMLSKMKADKALTEAALRQGELLHMSGDVPAHGFRAAEAAEKLKEVGGKSGKALGVVQGIAPGTLPAWATTALGHTEGVGTAGGPAVDAASGISVKEMKRMKAHSKAWRSNAIKELVGRGVPEAQAATMIDDVLKQEIGRVGSKAGRVSHSARNIIKSLGSLKGYFRR